MDAIDLEKIGLNRNEAKVYYALLQKNQATASELIKLLGMHRSMIYDNLERLIEKGLVSFVMKGAKKYFLAEEPESIIEFLDSKKAGIDQKINQAKKLMPDISKLLKTSAEGQEVKVFRGVKGLKKVLAETLTAKEVWGLGMTNESVDVLSPTYWKNYNSKVKANNIKEYFLVNADFRDTYYFRDIKQIYFRRLPPELNQVTEILMYDNTIAMFIYTKTPAVVVIKDKNIFQTFRQQFDFLWKLSK